MRARLLALAVLGLGSAAGCGSKPASTTQEPPAATASPAPTAPMDHRQAWSAGNRAYREGRVAEAEQLFTLAFEKASAADEQGLAATAAGFAGDLADMRGDYERERDLYNRLLSRHPYSVNRIGQRFRIQNNLAVVEYRFGNHAAARRWLEPAVAHFHDMRYSGTYPRGLHMLLLRNLSKVYLAEGWSPSAEATVQGVVAMVDTLDRMSLPIGPPVTETLLAYAELLKANGRTLQARVLEARAQESDPERAKVAYVSEFHRCETYPDTPFKTCYVEIGQPLAVPLAARPADLP